MLVIKPSCACASTQAVITQASEPWYVSTATHNEAALLHNS